MSRISGEARRTPRLAPEDGRTLNGCLVLTGPLTDAVRSFIAAWNRDRPTTDGVAGISGGGFRSEVNLVGGVEWLAAESGVPEETILYIKRGRYRTTELSTADALVQALGHPEWFHDDTLTVIPNPSAPRALRETCCGGSVRDDETALAATG